MKAFRSVIIIFILLAAAGAVAQPIRALVMIPNKYGANYYLDRDDMENFGWEVTTTSVTSTVIPCTDYAGPLGCPVITVDLLVSQIQDIGDYDILVVVSGGGGPGACANLINSPEALQLVQDAADSGLVVGAMCSGCKVLAAAGVLNGIHITSNKTDSAYCVNAGAIHEGICRFPVIDGQFVTTSIGDYYHHQNTEALMKAFCENHKKDLSGGFPSALSNASIRQESTVRATDSLVITTFGGALAEGARSVCKTQDGGYLVSGFTYSTGAGYADALLMKVDAAGIQQWSRTVGGNLPDFANACMEAEAGKYVSCGYTYSTGAGSADVLVFKTDASGNIIWSHTYGGTGFDIAKSVCRTSDGHYLVCGYTESYGNGKDDEYLLKLDTAGNLLWQKTYGNIESDMGTAVIESHDGAYIMAGVGGNITPNGQYGFWGDRDATLRKTDTSGVLVWEKKYNASTYQQYGKAVTETYNHHFLVAGDNDITMSELLDMYLVKADSNGVKKTTKSFGEGTYYDYGNAIAATSDSMFVLCGTTKSLANKDDMYYLKVDINGTLMDKQIIGGGGFDWGAAICWSPAEAVLAGQTDSYGSGKYDIMFVQLKSPATAISEIANHSGTPGMITGCWPNPFTSSLSVHITFSGNTSARLLITDIYGRTLKSFTGLKPGDQTLTWNGLDDSGRKVHPGMYFVTLLTETGSETQKVLLISE